MILLALLLFGLLVAGWLVAPKGAVKAPARATAVAEAPMPRRQLSESPA